MSNPPSPVSLSVGATSLNVWSSLPDAQKKYVKLYMVWDKPAGWDGPEVMRFDTGPGVANNNNCTLTSTHQMEATILFECQFNCEDTVGHRL